MGYVVPRTGLWGGGLVEGRRKGRGGMIKIYCTRITQRQVTYRPVTKLPATKRPVTEI
jgi:hypothetical protein